MGGSLLFKTEVSGSSLLGYLPKEFFLRLTWYPWLVGYYSTRGLVEVCVSWPGYPRYLTKKKEKPTCCIRTQTCKSLRVKISNRWCPTSFSSTGMILPVAKLGTLALRTICKPIASRLKKDAGLHPKFRQCIINIAQVFYLLCDFCLLALLFNFMIMLCE